MGRRVIGWVMVVLGLAVAGAGVAGIALVGSDGVVASPAATVYGDSRVAVSGPGLLAWKNTTLHVTASNPAGTVFLGLAHPVDVRDLTSGVTTYTVTDATRSGLSGRLLTAKGAQPAADPARLDIWSAKVSGPGAQSLALPLSGATEQLYVGPVGTGGPLTVSIGREYPGVYAGSLVAVVAGLLLVAGGLFLALRRRRSPGTTPAEPAGPGADRVEGSAVGRASEGRAVPGGGTTLALLVAVPALALSGCGAGGTAVAAWDPATVRKPALQQSDVAAMWKSYNDRNTAAIKQAAAPTYSAKGWSAADVDAVLVEDDYDTAYARVAKDATKPHESKYSGKVVYAPAFSSYPQFLIARGTDVTYEKAKWTTLSVMRRDGVEDHWRMAARAPAPSTAVPGPAAVGADSTASAAQRKAALKVADAVCDYLKTGRAAGFAPDATLKANRAEFTLDASEKTYLRGKNVSCGLFGNAEDQTAADGSVRVVRTSSGAVAVASLAASWASETKPDSTVYWKSATYAEVMGQTGRQRSSIEFRGSLSVAVVLPPTGTPKVVGSSLDSIR